MAVKRLTDGVDENDIVDLTDVEELNRPNMMIDEDYAISGCYGDYALVQRKIAHRTGKVEDGVNNGKVIKYTTWITVQPHSYGGTPFDILENYRDYVSLQRFKKLDKENDFGAIRKIYDDIGVTVAKFFKSTEFTKEIKQQGALINEITQLKEELSRIKSILKEADELHELVKAKRKIVIDDTEPKKPKFKKVKEEEEVEDGETY